MARVARTDQKGFMTRKGAWTASQRTREPLENRTGGLVDKGTAAKPEFKLKPTGQKNRLLHTVHKHDEREYKHRNIINKIFKRRNRTYLFLKDWKVFP